MINQTTDSIDTVNEDVQEEYWIEMSQALARLEAGNPKPDDFKRVILEGYFKDRAINGVSVLADRGVKERGERAEVMEDLIAVSNLQQFFIMVHNLGFVDTEAED